MNPGNTQLRSAVDESLPSHFLPHPHSRHASYQQSARFLALSRLARSCLALHSNQPFDCHARLILAGTLQTLFSSRCPGALCQNQLRRPNPTTDPHQVRSSVIRCPTGNLEADYLSRYFASLDTMQGEFPTRVWLAGARTTHNVRSGILSSVLYRAYRIGLPGSPVLPCRSATAVK